MYGSSNNIRSENANTSITTSKNIFGSNVADSTKNESSTTITVAGKDKTAGNNIVININRRNDDGITKSDFATQTAENNIVIYINSRNDDDISKSDFATQTANDNVKNIIEKNIKNSKIFNKKNSSDVDGSCKKSNILSNKKNQNNTSTN